MKKIAVTSSVSFSLLIVLACGSSTNTTITYEDADAPVSEAGVSDASKEAAVDGGPDAGPCTPSCATNFVCDPFAKRCLPEPTSRWTLTIERGEISAQSPAGNAWDIGGSPDPYVCIYLNGASTPTCTSEALDTFTPTWNFTLPVLPASDIFLKGFDFEVWDNDVTTSDPICAKTHFPMLEGDFVNEFSFGCPTTTKIFAKMTAQ